MPRQRSWRRIGGILGLTVLAAWFSAPPAASAGTDRFRLVYTIWVTQIPLLDVTTVVDLAPDRYLVDARTATGGWLAWAAPWEAHSRVIGEVQEGNLAPRRYSGMAVWRDHEQGLVIDFRHDGTVATDYRPPWSAADNEPVPDALKTSALDPLSAVIALFREVGETGHCPTVLGVFDGRRRFDMTAETLGTETLPATDFNAFAGPAVICRIRVKTLAGHHIGGEVSRFWRHDTNQTDRPPLDLWLGRVAPDLPPVAVKLEAWSVIGWVSIHLKSITREPSTLAAEWPAALNGQGDRP